MRDSGSAVLRVVSSSSSRCSISLFLSVFFAVFGLYMLRRPISQCFSNVGVFFSSWPLLILTVDSQPLLSPYSCLSFYIDRRNILCFSVLRHLLIFRNDSPVLV